MEDKRKVLNVFKKVVDGDLKRVIINMPFLSGKTTLLEDFMIKHINDNNKAKFIYVTSKKESAVDVVRNVASKVDSDFESRRTMDRFYSDGQSLNLMGIMTGEAICGYGAGGLGEDDLFGGALILDDPNRFMSSETNCSQVYDMFQNTLRCRVNNKNTPIIIIQTNTNRKNDLGNMLLKKDRDNWYHLNLE